MLKLFKIILFLGIFTDITAQIRLYYKINMQPTFENGSKCGCERLVSYRLFENSVTAELIIDKNDAREKKGLSGCQENSAEQRDINPFRAGSGFLNKTLIPDYLESMIYIWSSGLRGLLIKNNMPRNIDKSTNRLITRVAHKAGYDDCDMKAEFDGEFVYVPEPETYPLLVTPNDKGVISGTQAIFIAPSFLRFNFTADKIQWRIKDGVNEIYSSTGYEIKYDMDDQHKCHPIEVTASVETDGYSWFTQTFVFEFRPETNVDLNIASPVCIASQSNDDSTKWKGSIALNNKLTEKIYNVSIYDRDKWRSDITLDKLIPSYHKLDVDYSPYTFEIAENLGNNKFACPLRFEDIKLYYPEPISIKDTHFTNIPCYGQTSKLSITIDGNTNNYSLVYGDSLKVLNKSQNYVLPLMTQTRSYSFNLTDENGCKYDQALNFSATEPPKLEAALQIDTALCYKGAATVIVNAKGGTVYDVENPYRYAFWPTTGTQLSSVYTTKGGATVYPRVMDKNNCTFSFPSMTLSNPKDFKLSVVRHSDNICPKGLNGSILLISQSPAKQYTYTYSMDGNIYDRDSLFQGLGAGTYTLHSKNQNGCQKDTIIEITQPPLIAITQTSLDSVRCFGEKNGSITLNITGGSGYKRIWKNNASSYLPQNRAYSFTYKYDSLPDLKYWFQAQDSLGCRDSVSYNIGTKSRIEHRSVLDKPSCYESNNGKATVYVSGGKPPYQHNWLGHPEFGSKLQITALTKGSYLLQSTDQLNCMKLDTFILTAPPALQVKLEGYPLLCKGQTLELDAGMDGDRYEWIGNNGFKANTRKVTLDKSGTYWVYVRDYNSCEGKDSITLEQSNTEFKADFLVATTVAQGDTVVLLNNNIWIDSLNWNLAPPVQYISHSEDHMSQQVSFGALGEQEITMTGYYKGCRDVKKRKIMVVSPQDRIKSDQSIGIKTSIIKECHLFPNPNDGSFEVIVELRESGIPVALALSSMATGTVLKRLDWQLYPENKVSFTEDLPEGPYVIHVKVRDEIVALRFLVAYD